MKKRIISTNCETYCDCIIKINNNHSLLFWPILQPYCKGICQTKVKLQYPAQLHIHKVDVDNWNLPNKSTITDGCQHNNLIWVTVITSWLPISVMFGREKHVLMEKNPDNGGDKDILKPTWDSIDCVKNDVRKSNQLYTVRLTVAFWLGISMNVHSNSSLNWCLQRGWPLYHSNEILLPHSLLYKQRWIQSHQKLICNNLLIYFYLKCQRIISNFEALQLFFSVFCHSNNFPVVN